MIYERARFNRRTQQDGESAEQFIVALYTLAESCEYGEMKEQLIRDRLVVGIRDTVLSKRLQLDADLTLEKAKKAVRQKEVVHEHQQVLREGESRTNPIHVDAVRTRQRHRQRSVLGKRDVTSFTKAKKHCTRCGGNLHQRESCPARDAVCHNCQKKGHYSSQCFAKNISSVQAAEFTLQAAEPTVQAVESSALES